MDIRLSMDDLIAFVIPNEPGIKIGVRGHKEHCHDIFYNGKRYHDSQVEVIEYGRNNGELCDLYRAIEIAYPKYVTKHPDDFVSFFLTKQLKLNELARVERAYNKLVEKSNTDPFTKLINKR